MKRTATIILTAVIAALFLSSCDYRSVAVSPNHSMTLDTGDGPKPYSGGILPENPGGEAKTYIFTAEFDHDPATIPHWPTLIVGPSTFPYELSLNGHVLHRYGDLDSLERARMYSTALIYIPEQALARRNVITVKARIALERVAMMDLAFADSRAGSIYVFWRNFFMSQLQAAGLAIGLLLFVYFMFMYTLGKGKEPKFLWFSLFCGFFSMACVNVVFNHEGVTDTFITKIGRVGFIIDAAFLSFYVMEMTSVLARRKWVKAIIGAATLFGVGIVLIQPDFTSMNNAFHTALNVAITPNLVFCLVVIGVGVKRDGFRPYAILSAGFAGVIVASLFDMVMEKAYVTPYAWALVYGYSWLVVCVFLELALKQERISRTAVAQAATLNEKNSILESVFVHLKEGSDSLRASSEELAVSTREISTTGSQQAAAVKEIVSTMEDANALLASISQKSSSVRADSRGTAVKADEGAAGVRVALEKLEGVIGRISESISMIAEFNERLGSITDIVKLIESIATQIRIIAFNASLEVVAAGEAGRNFRIVAEEVKRLADSTMSSVKNIREKVNGLISMSDDVVKVARQGYQSLEQSWDIASGIGTSFSGIAEAADSSARAAADIDASIREESGAFDQIVQTLKEISGGVNNFVESANHTSETTDRLNRIAEQLHDLIAKYSGGGTPPAASPSLRAEG